MLLLLSIATTVLCGAKNIIFLPRLFFSSFLTREGGEDHQEGSDSMSGPPLGGESRFGCNKDLSQDGLHIGKLMARFQETTGGHFLRRAFLEPALTDSRVRQGTENNPVAMNCPC